MKKILLIPLLSTLFFAACDDAMTDMNATLELTFSGLSDLGGSEVYEGWILVDGSPVSTGTFTVDGSGNPSRLEFAVSADDLAAATAFVLSVEPANDPDPAPSAIKILSGDFIGNAAALDLGIIADFSTIAGDYILATPSSNAATDELSGIWFVDLTGGSPAAGLDLPDLSGVSGWTYEGWAVFPGASGPISTGSFDDPLAADVNGAGPYKGPDSDGPPFPGDDFITGSIAGITFPSDLSGGMAVISVEPVPDNSDAPFLVKPLVGSIPAGAVDHMTYAAAVNLVSGTATR